MDRTDQLALPAPQAQRSWRNPALGQLADALTAAADVCIHPLVIVPLFIATLTESTVTVGLAVALVLGASALAHPLAAAFGHRALFRFGGLMGAVGLRAFALFSLAGTPVLYRGDPARQLNTGLLLLAAAALLDGLAAPLRLEFASGASAEAPLSRLRGRWALLGALAGVGGAFAVRPLLDRANLVGPAASADFVRVFLSAGVALTLATLCVVLMQPAAAPSPARGIVAQLSAFSGLVADNLAYGRFVVFRFLYALGAVAEPFYILYAVRELGGDGRTASIYLIVLALARAMGILLWRALGAQGGNRMVLQLCAFVRLLAPITALTLPPLLGSATLRDRLPGGNAISLIAFALVFAAAGVASAGLDLAAPVVQASITTPRERPAAGVLTHLALGVAAVAVLLGGVITDRLGFPFLFIVALVAGLGALLAGGLVDEPNLVVLRAPPSDRPAPRRRRRVRRED